MTRKIKVKSLTFVKPPFRKLGNFSISFADRLTLIAGHNGIGKSTILGLVANTFGITERSAPKTYLGDPFYANIEQIVYLALDEVAEAQKDAASAPLVIASVDGVEVKKRCSLTQRTKWQRARVVPRTVEKSDGDAVGQDAKVPLPTIYLGMKRFASAGEAEEKDVSSVKLAMHAEDSALMREFVSAVILGAALTNDVNHQSIKGARKKSAQPGYEKHGPFAVSMGQDSLGSIATALASFSKLKREMSEDYPGGLLVVDEMDVGFHPHAIERLVKSLKTYAKRLDLQIIATTHSPRLIEAVHPDGDGNANAPDSVIYLLDTRHPRIAKDQSLRAILNDMALLSDDAKPAKKIKPTLGIYFEDDEAAEFCSGLISTTKKSALVKKYGVRINWIPLGVGGSNLLGFPTKDPLFLDRVLVVDADTAIPAEAAARGNAVKLPCVAGSAGTARSSENTIKQFLKDISAADDGALHEALLNLNITNPTSDRIQTTFFEDGAGASAKRDPAKKWWTKNWAKLKKWQVIERWADVYKTEVGDFETELERAIAHTVSRLTKSS
jgi:energy-coupling factor transporter ATP-binding protein EcfA2